MTSRLNDVIKEESADVTEDGMQALVRLGKGDMRRSLNILQCTHVGFSLVNEENVYMTTGNPLRSDIQQIIDWMLNEDFTTAYTNISTMKSTKGLALGDILMEVHTFVHRIDFPRAVRITLLDKLAEAEYRLSAGTSEKLQLSGLIAAFQCVRDTVAAEAR
jgi:replication factor C subunit 3/5